MSTYNVTNIVLSESISITEDWNAYLFDTPDTAYTVTLYDSSEEDGIWLAVKNVGSNDLTILPIEGKTIDGESSLVLAPMGKGYLVASGGNWYVM